MNPTRVLVVDDHRVFADAIAARLNAEPDLDVVGTAASAREAIVAVNELRPDLALIDVELGGADGIYLTHVLREEHPSLVVVIVSLLNDPLYVRDAVSSGAMGWVTKDAPTDQLLSAIRGAMRGESWIPPSILTGVLKELLQARREADEQEGRLARLTPRERHVLESMADGLDRTAIAERLFLSTNTVRTHVQNILTKLEVHSSLEAVALALRVRPRLSLSPEVTTLHAYSTRPAPVGYGEKRSEVHPAD